MTSYKHRVHRKRARDNAKKKKDRAKAQQKTRRRA